MKTPTTFTTITLMLALAAIAAPTAARAADTADYEKSYLDAYRNKSHVNALPVSVETPVVDPELLDGEDLPLDVKVEFTVDAKGKPTRMVVKSDAPFDIASPVLDAIYDWRFTPAIRNGKPAAERMSLTVRFVDADDDNTVTASNKPVIAKATLVALDDDTTPAKG